MGLPSVINITTGNYVNIYPRFKTVCGNFIVLNTKNDLRIHIHKYLYSSLHSTV